MYFRSLRVIVVILGILLKVVYPLPEASKWRGSLFASEDVEADLVLDEHGSLDLEFGTVQWLEPAFRDNEVDLMLDEEGPFDFDYGAIESLDESNKYARAVRPPPTKPSATPSPKPANSIPSKPGNPQKSQPQPPTQVPVNKKNGDDDDRIQCSPDLCPTYYGPSKGSSAATKL